MTVPSQYAWILKEGAPRMIVEGLKLFGTVEMPGNADSPIILSWARETDLSRIYSHDSIPWCGLYMALVAKRADKTPPKNPLWALNWANFGVRQSNDGAMLGDVLTFVRDGGGHVAMYVGEDSQAFHLLGGNQRDQVCFTRIAKARLHSVARPIYATAQPVNVRKIHLSATGTLSSNEA
jgi:uncharacterized protein (TIGR02594 family)